MFGGGSIARAVSRYLGKSFAPHRGSIILPPISAPAHPRNRHRQAADCRWSRTTKHASCSSTDQGGGKRRAGIDFRMENRGGAKLISPPTKRASDSIVIDNRMLGLTSITCPPHRGSAGFLFGNAHDASHVLPRLSPDDFAQHAIRSDWSLLFL